ncbi:hypothetical protein FB451DRAFT_1570101 [Mycena latifolia]|nr:hypothetical protein FB451DRAFT_1570101 [Mycena latifolia]
MSASVTVLLARLEEFSLTIEAQKQVPAELEHIRSTVQRQLNSLRDPITQFPLEISSEIFIMRTSSRTFTARVPALFPHPDPPALARAPWDYEIGVIVAGHSFPVEKSSHVSQPSQFATCCIASVPRTNLYRLFNPPRTSANKYTLDSRIDTSEAHADVSVHLTLPALESLDIPFRDRNVDDLIPFLTRSSPPLKSLTLDPGDTTSTQQTIKHCFGLTHALTHLEFRGSADFQHSIISLLADSLSNTFLPHLATLAVVAEPFSDNGWYITLADMLSVRQTSSNGVVTLQSLAAEGVNEAATGSTNGTARS